jgi:hypothetical protein
MPQKDDEAAELKHAEEISLMIFPATNQSAEVVEPGEEAFDSPAAAVTAQLATILSTLAAANVLVGRDESNVVFLPQALVERIAVVLQMLLWSFSGLQMLARLPQFLSERQPLAGRDK